MTTLNTFQPIQNDITQTSYILSNLIPKLSKEEKDAELVQVPFLDLTMTFNVRIDSERSYQLTTAMLQNMHASANFVQDCAKTLAEEEVICTPLHELLGLPDGGFPMYVLTTKEGTFGAASAMLNTAALKKLAERLDVEELIVLPSSVHEVIAIPVSDDMESEELNGMIRSINESQVSPAERLSDHLYRYRATDNHLTF